MWWSVLALSAVSGYLLYYLNSGQNLWFYAVAVIVSGLAILKFPSVGLYVIFFCTLLFERHFTLQSLIIGEIEYKLYPIDIIIGLTALSLFLKVVAGKEKLSFNKFDYPIIYFGLATTISFVYALLTKVNPSLAFGAYKNYFLYAIVYFLAIFIFKTREDWGKMMFWFSFGAILMFYFLAYGLITGHGLWSEYTPLSTSGERLIAGTHAFYFVIFGFWLTALYFWHKEEKMFGKKEILFAVFFVLLALVVSLVRHLWLAILVLLAIWLVYLPIQNRQTLYKIFISSVVAITAVSLVFAWGYGLATGSAPRFVNKYVYILKERASFGNVVSLQDESFRWRVSAWLAGLSLWRSSPVWGIGLGHPITGYDELYFFEIPPRDLHNNYLGIFVQAGLLGFAAIVYWFVYLLRCLNRIWDRLKNSDNFDTKLFFVWGNAVLLFMIVFSISVYWDINLFIVWWWLSLAAMRYLAQQTKSL